jgi:cytochrome c oxidase assembly factor 3, fungi type
MSPGLRRARQPFFLRNTITGVILASFAAGVWAYSLSAVKQDDFADVDEEARALGRAGVHAAEGTAAELQKKTIEHTEAAAPGGVVTPIPAAPGDVSAVPSTRLVTTHSAFRMETRPRGVVASLVYNHYPQLLDPTTKTFVWGAPSVDNIGRMGDVSPSTRK